MTTTATIQIDSTDLSEWREQVQKNRSEAMVDFFPVLPEHVLGIDSCEAKYTFEPRAFPYKNIQFSLLRDALKHEYGFSFRPPDSGALAQIIPPNLQTPDEIGQLLMRMQDVQLLFENGLLKVSDGRAVSIQRIVLDSESIFVKVFGPTSAAEQIIVELLPLLWRLAGVKQTWSELAKLHQVAQYGTGTKVRLANAARPLLSQSFVSLLNDWTKPHGFATQMGSRTQIQEFNPPEDSLIRYTLDELHILFHRQTIAGFSETNRLRIGVRAKHEYGTGIVSIDTELPFPEHIELIKEIISLGRQ